MPTTCARCRALRAGHYLVGVAVGDDEEAKRRAADALRGSPCPILDYYAENYIEDLRATG